MLLKAKKCPNCGAYYDPTLEKCPSCHKHNELYLNREINTHIVFMHPIAQIGLFLGGFYLAGMLLIQLIIAQFLDGISDLNVKTAIVVSVTYFLMLAGLLCIILFTRRKDFIKKYQRPIVDYIYGLAYAITVILACALLNNITNIFHEITDNANQSTVVTYSHSYPVLAFFVLGLIGPICEELTYRVGLYSFLRRINKYLAIVVTTIVFALIHFSFEAEDIVNELWALPQYLLAGFILTLAYEHRGPACSMTAHALYNIFAFLMVLSS